VCIEFKKKMSIVVLVARYNEDIRWIRWLKIENIDRVVVIDKGMGDVRMHHSFDPEKIRCFTGAPNVGREGHTFYQFIVDNYFNLPDHLVLLQGNPFDHSPHIIDRMNAFTQEPYEKRADFFYLSEEFEKVDLDGLGHFTPAPLPMRSVWEHIFHEASPEHKEWIFGAGAQFVVSKRAILSRPCSVYERIVHLLKHEADPIEGYCMERLHPIVFRMF
jgi:hypothetical protein